MLPKGDYSCEIMGLIVLTVLSALSHFWFFMIALCILSALVAAGFLLSKIFILAHREMLARFHRIAGQTNGIPEGQRSVDITRSAGQSWPAA